MQPRQIIRSGLAASAIAHVSVLTLVSLYTQVHPYSPVITEPVAVELVAPPEAKPALEPKEPPKTEPSDAFNLFPQPAAAAASPAVPEPPAVATPPQPQPAAPTPRPNRRQAKANATPLPQQSQQQALQQQPPVPSPQPAHAAPEPDLTIRYNVVLGLPPDLPAGRPQGNSDENFDAPAAQAAKVEDRIRAAFRSHLKTCSKLLGSVAVSDDDWIRLRILMTPEGNLAAEPLLIGGSPSGPRLKPSAIAALSACQPYMMLPPERYEEWKVLDLSIRLRDFSGG